MTDGMANATTAVSTVDLADLTPDDFWKSFVSKRQPVCSVAERSAGIFCIQVKIVGYPTDASWKATEKWSLPYLRDKAVRLFVERRVEISRQGECEVRVEMREALDATFGKGHIISMKFRDFLRGMECGDPSLYLTAQDVRKRTWSCENAFCDRRRSKKTDFLHYSRRH